MKEQLEVPLTEVDKEREEFKNRIALLERLVLEGKSFQPQPQVQVEHPATSDFKAPLQKPKRILFTIGALEEEDAKHDGVWIPGKAVVSLFKFSDYLSCNEYGTRYTTGFEYDEIENTSGLEGEKLDDYLKEVRVARQWIERYYPANLSADNAEFWKKRVLVIEDFDRIYDTRDNLENLILYYNILGGGYSLIARNHDEARTNRNLKNQRLYLSVSAEEEERKFSNRSEFINANAVLSDMIKNSSITDALYLYYYLPFKKYKGYHINTPMQTIINELSDFIEGTDTKIDKKKRPKMFLDTVEDVKNKKDIVRTTATFRAAQYYGFIVFNKAEKSYKNLATGFSYGNSEKGAVEGLLNPNHIDELSWIKAKVKEKWTS